MSHWKVHSKEDMIVSADPKSNFPISIELTFGTREHSPARMEDGVGAWFGVEDAALLIAELREAIDKVLSENKLFYYYGREVTVTDMKNGRFVWETDRDESGYVTAKDLASAIVEICNQIKHAVAVEG
jgi:hypothetical protein